MKNITETVPAPAQVKSVPVSAVTAEVNPKKSGKDLPVIDLPEKVSPVAYKKFQEHVEAAVAEMNDYIQSSQRDLHFTYDKDAGETVVKVLSRETQEVIRQIPDETFLKLARDKGFNGSLQLLSVHA